MEPMTVFSYFWRPYAINPAIEYSKEDPTLAMFRLKANDLGTRLTITEAGFARVPIGRRAEALQMNTRGWETQANRLKAYVEG